MAEVEDEKSPLDEIANIASVANAIASLVVGHRKILVDGGFNVDLSDSMCAELHAHLLGLGPVWAFDDNDLEWPDVEEEE